MKEFVKFEIVETQRESEVDDETLFTLFADGRIVSWAKTTLYSKLEDIHTVHMEKRKGYSRLLLSFIEKNAQNHGATSMKTSDFQVCNVEATGFLKHMLYTINPSVSWSNAYVNGIKVFESFHEE